MWLFDLILVGLLFIMNVVVGGEWSVKTGGVIIKKRLYLDTG